MQSPKSAREWILLWWDDRPKALELCDRIVASRPVPDALLARLNRTTKMERAASVARTTSRRYCSDLDLRGARGASP